MEAERPNLTTFTKQKGDAVNYPTLRIVAFIWKLVGFVALIASIALIVFALVADGSTIGSLVFRITTRAGIVTLARLGFLFGGIGGAWVSLITIALGDLVRVVIQIEANTRV